MTCMVSILIKKSLRLLAPIIVIAGAGFVTWDVYTPTEINWENYSPKSDKIKKAPQLIVQHQDGDAVWATIGYSIYRSECGGAFTKILTMRPRLGLAWLGYSKVARLWSGNLELAEVVPLSPDLLVVFAGGDIYRVELGTKTQQRAHRLRYFGLGKGRGVMPHGIAVDAKGSIYYGEYPTLRNNEHDVRLYRSDDKGRTWKVAFEFAPGQIRHIHAVRWDPIGKAIWVGTGDTDSQARIGYSNNGGKTFQWIGSGSQLFRTVSMLFFDDAMVWVADTNEPDYMRTASWNREENRINVGNSIVSAPAYYALKLSDHDGIVTLAEQELSVWSINPKQDFHKLIEWPTPKVFDGPNPSVRLPRGTVWPSKSTYVSPLRTAEEAAATYEIPLSLLNPQSIAIER